MWSTCQAPQPRYQLHLVPHQHALALRPHLVAEWRSSSDSMTKYASGPSPSSSATGLTIISSRANDGFSGPVRHHCGLNPIPRFNSPSWSAWVSTSRPRHSIPQLPSSTSPDRTQNCCARAIGLGPTTPVRETRPDRMTGHNLLSVFVAFPLGDFPHGHHLVPQRYWDKSMETPYQPAR